MIKRAHISEKSMDLARNGFYTFVIGKHLTKLDIAKMVADKFKVDVIDVRIVNTPVKKRSMRVRRGTYIISPVKKALVRVKSGQKIPYFEVTKEAEVTKVDETPKEKPKKEVKKIDKKEAKKVVEKKESKGRPKTTKEKSIAKKKGNK